jgi:hypothetical protein
MYNIFQLVLLAESGPLEMVKAHRKATILLCQQTTECALFIRDYASRDFGMILRCLQLFRFDLSMYPYSRTNDHVIDQWL